MADDSIPRDIGDFILRYIDSIAQLEALLLLRANPGETWDVGKTAKRLYAGEAEIAAALSRLKNDGLLSGDQDLYRYECADPGLRDAVDRLASAYSRQLIAVTNLIHSKPRRIREFADAFKLRKDR